MTSNIDTKVANYSISELMAIVELQGLEPDEIVEQTNKYIEKFKTSNPVLSVFFMEIQSQLLQYSSDLIDPNNQDASFTEGFESMNNDDLEATYPSGEKQQDNWYENQALPQDNKNQKDKTTERKQKIDVFGNTHVPMNREQLGVNNNFNVPVAQDSLNPNLKNTISRFVNLDSQFRQYTSGAESTSTDYTLDLSDPLTNVLSMRMYSYQIPYSWYVIDIPYGNTCFWITETVLGVVYNVPVTVPPGNYTPTQFEATLSAILNELLPPGPTTLSYVVYNVNNGKLTLNLNGGVYLGQANPYIPTFPITETTIITFFDYTAQLQCETNCVNRSFYLNQTLGWIMGFREAFVYVDTSGNTGTGIVDLNGTKYLILVIDDYNQNHVNNGLVSITEYSNVLKMPSYYSPDLPYTCLTATPNNGINSEYTKTQIMLPSAPRTLTNSQLYTINEINKNRNNNTNHRAKAPTSTDILAMIPIKPTGLSTGALIIEFSGSLQDNSRTYFGPVNIDRMRVKLLNDKGNVLNMNGADWCVTLICDCLYQY
jgi:hypothetical protein